jgi:DEAD/DEAH box helicase domain-containing protein
MTFGNSGGNSPFAGLGASSNGFGGGSAFGGSSFGSAIGGSKPLSSFAAPGTKPMPVGKPAKPFGAPDSDAEEDEEDDNEDEEDSQPDDVERGASPDKEKDVEEKKRFKLQKGTFSRHCHERGFSCSAMN